MMKKNLRKKAIASAKKAYAPYSHYYVGCALLTQKGEIFSGCNVENSSYGGTICAERVAITKAVSEGFKKFKEIYIYTHNGVGPCGLCLQMMSEFFDQETVIILGNKKGQGKIYSLAQLLPLAFTPDQLTLE
ncbi:MAG: cytidine deaminase [Bacteriovoracaceae bacterium]|nr:cytidine deaminase [Bacteriovoracaceae bacterium]